MKLFTAPSALRRGFADLLRGAAIGASMLLPGVSGGTMAIILGIYDRLVAGVSGLLRAPRRHLPLLATVALGGLLGAACFSGVLLSLVESYPKPMHYLFLGAVAGSIPLLFKKARLRRPALDSVLYLLVGFFTALLAAGIPQNLFRPDPGSLPGYLLLILAGVLLSVALVLPGISASYMLLVLGLYETTLAAVSRLQIPYLLCLGGGLALGTLCTTRLLEKAMNRHPQPTYLVIAGFVAAALREVYPGIPSPSQLPWCAASLLLGGGSVLLLSRRYGDA